MSRGILSCSFPTSLTVPSVVLVVMVTVCQRPSLTVVWRVRVVSWGEEEEEELCDRTTEPSSS